MFLAEAEKLGRELARAGLTVVYGGSTAGLMGRLAQGVLDGGGHLVGVIPEMDFMNDQIHTSLGETVRVRTLAERKTQMIMRSDGFLVMPGGIGTLDEATEVLALNAVEAIRKPLVFYDFLGVWMPFIESLDLLHKAGFIGDAPSKLFQVFDESSSMIRYLKNAR